MRFAPLRELWEDFAMEDVSEHWMRVEPELTGTSWTGHFVIEWPLNNSDLEVDFFGQSVWIAYNRGSLQEPRGGVRLDFGGVTAFTFEPFDYDLFGARGSDGPGLGLWVSDDSALLAEIRERNARLAHGDMTEMRQAADQVRHFHLSANNTANVSVAAQNCVVRPFDLPEAWASPGLGYSDREQIVRDSASALVTPEQ